MVTDRILHHNVCISDKRFSVTVDLDSVVFRFVYTNDVSIEIFHSDQSYSIPYLDNIFFPYITIDLAVAAFTKSANESLCNKAVTDDFRPSCINSVCAILGLIILLGLYARIFRDIYFLKERLHNISISMKKSAVTIFLVILAYFACYLPHWMYNFMQIILDADLSYYETAFTIECLSYVLYALNTFFDPVIYSFRIPVIRKIYFQLWLKMKPLCAYR